MRAEWEGMAAPPRCFPCLQAAGLTFSTTRASVFRVALLCTVSPARLPWALALAWFISLLSSWSCLRSLSFFSRVHRFCSSLSRR